jgi:DNA-binding response OmpR family regulator
MSLPVKIVMIEDDEGHARLIERNIRRSGVNNEILPFTNGSDAVKYLFGKDGSGAEHKDQALLILLDLNLPDMTGIDILKRIKENTHVKCAPVVVLTTTDDEQKSSAATNWAATSTLPSRSITKALPTPFASWGFSFPVKVPPVTT